jgi:hypothetical protein
LHKLESTLESLNWESSVTLDSLIGILNLKIVYSDVLETNSAFPFIFSVSTLEHVKPSPILWSFTFYIDCLSQSSPNGLNKYFYLSSSIPIPESIISVEIYFIFYTSYFTSSFSNWSNSSSSYILIAIII